MTHRHAKEARERFAKDTANHSLEVLLDNGIYRHLKCSNGGSSIYRFDIVTWPGYLAVSRDMGEYMFCRLEDMFQFFRSRDGGINIGYWAEKCEAADTSSRNGTKGYDADSARELIKRRLRECYEGQPGQYRKALQIAKDKVNYDEGIVRFYDSVMELELPGERHLIESEDLESTEEYTFHFIWVLHAIVWAINQYDKQKAAATVAQAVA